MDVIEPSDDHPDQLVHPARSVTDFDDWPLIELSPDGVVLADEDGTIVLVNAQVEAIFGYSRAELVGRSVDELLPSRDRQAHRAHRTRYRAVPQPRPMGVGLDLRARRRDGTEFPVEISLSPVRSKNTLHILATVRDVTQRRAAEAETHAVMHTLDATRDGVFMFTPDTLQFTYVNQGAVGQLGYSSDELLTMSPLHIKPEFTETRFREMIKPVIADDVASFEFTTVHRRKDGGDVPVEIVLEYPPALPGSGAPRRLVAVVRDITDRLDTERIARQSQEAFRTAFDAAPVGMALVDTAGPSQGQISNANAALCQLLGYAQSELVGKRIAELSHPNDRGLAEQPYEPAALDGTQSLERRYLHADGHGVWVWVHSAVLHESEAESESNKVLIQVMDLTERNQASAERERLRVLEDRERLAEDLHDLVIQRLFAAGMGLQSMQSAVTDERLTTKLNAAVDQIDLSIAELRSTIFKLSTPGPTALQEELEQIIGALSPTLGFVPTLEIHGDPNVVPGVVVEQLLPVVSEALSNVGRHAQATAATVSLRVGAEIALAVSDNGIGVAPDTTDNRLGNGLSNMSARAERLHGSMTLRKNPGKGATLAWIVPR